jgi:transposase
MQTQTFRELTDEEWEKVRALIPPASKEGRPRSDDRRTLNAILFVLQANIPWNYLPHEFGDDSTANRRFREWVREGVWRQIEQALDATGYRTDGLRRENLQDRQEFQTRASGGLLIG